MVGLLLVLLSSVFFCVQNVIVRVLFSSHTLVGGWQTGGFVAPTLENSFLLLAMRMLWVVPLMAGIVPRLYPHFWQEVRALGRTDQRMLLGRSLLGGCLMFLYLALLYVSIGLIPTGIALTLFFTYPVFTALMSGWWLGNDLNPTQWSIMALILVGGFLTIPRSDAILAAHLWLGVILGISSGIAYALYAVNAQKSFETMHPIPFTWISFAIALGLSSLCLGVWHSSVPPTAWMALWIGGFLSAIATSCGHLLNNLGIRSVGATTAAMVSSSNPALTALLAWITLSETLNSIQIAGVVLVTVSVGFLSQVHRHGQTKIPDASDRGSV